VYSSGTTIWHIIEALYYIYIIRNKLDFCCVSLSFFHTKLFTTKYVFSHDYEIQLFRPNPFQWQFEHGRTLMFVYKMFVVVSLLLVSVLIKSQGWSQNDIFFCRDALWLKMVVCFICQCHLYIVVSFESWGLLMENSKCDKRQSNHE